MCVPIGEGLLLLTIPDVRLISNAKVVQVVEALPLRAKDVRCGCVDGVVIVVGVLIVIIVVVIVSML